MPQRLLDPIFRWWAGVVTRRAWLILITCLILAAGATVLSSLRLEFRSSRSELLSPDLPWNARFLDWIGAFQGTEDLFVIIDAAPSRERAEALADALGAALDGAEWVERAVWKIDPAQVHPRTLRLATAKDFDRRLDQIRGARLLLESPTPQALIAAALSRMQQAGQQQQAADAATPETIEAFGGMLRAFTQRMRTPAEEPVDIARQIETPEAASYFGTSNGRLLIIRVTPRPEPGVLSKYERAIDQTRAILDRFRGEFPDVEFGLTGIQVIQADETAAATRDSAFASSVAAVLVAVLMVLAFRGLRLPVLLMVGLNLGIAWSFGFVTLSVGHLQIISVVFAALLLGLGGDFGVHIATRYDLVRRRYANDAQGFREALFDVFHAVGPGVITGAVTTAAAFATTMLTDFTGVAEMGLIAGGGVLLCALAMFTAFVALLRIVRWRHEQVPEVQSRKVQLFREAWAMPFVRRPWVTLAVAGIVVVASGAAMTRMRFNYNLLDLLPRDVESVEWQQRLVRDGEQSVWFGVSIADSMEQARQRAQAFRELPGVAAVRGIGLLFPQQEQARLAAIRTAYAELEPALAGADAASVGALQQSLLVQLGALRLGLAANLGRDIPPVLRTALDELLGEIDAFLAAARSLDEPTRQARLAALQSDYAAWRSATAQRIRAALDEAPLEPADLPPGVVTPYVSDEAAPRYAIEVYAKIGQGADELAPAQLRRFVRELRRVDENVTGAVVQIYESGTLIYRSYVLAGVYALALVFVLVLIDFRNVWQSLLTLVPVAVGFVVTFGVMMLLGESINAANIIVLPLMFGIGVDAGVQMLHRFRQEPLAQPPGLVGGTGKAITVTQLTTMIGFGCLMLARHRGIYSLGFVMALGIGMTLLACWTVMPAVLEILRRRRNRIAATDS